MIADVPKHLEVLARHRCGGDADYQNELVHHPGQKSWEEPSLPRWKYGLWDIEEELAALARAGFAVVPHELLRAAAESLRREGAHALADQAEAALVIPPEDGED